MSYDQEQIQKHRHDWYCELFIPCMFSFNHSEDDQKSAIAVNQISTLSSLNNSGLVFHPFEMSGRISPPSEIDQNLHVYNNIDFQLSQYDYCNEDSFP